MTKNFTEVYAKKMEAQKKAILGSKITEQLELKALSNQRLEELYRDMSNITKKPVYEDFNFRTGKIMGILRHIFQNPKQRKELLELTGLSQAHIDLYYQVCGNLPYVNTNTNTVNIGRQMDVESTRELMQATGATLGVLVEEGDLIDLTEDNWKRMYAKALDDAAKTVEFNAQNAGQVYEE